jgi:hypothetical protein
MPNKIHINPKIKDAMKTQAGKDILEFFYERYDKLNDISRMEDAATAEEQAIVYRGHKLAIGILGEIGFILDSALAEIKKEEEKEAGKDKDSLAVE